MVLDIARADVGKGNRIQPPQHTEFGLRVTQPIEDHDAQKRLHIDAVAGAPKHLAQLCKAQRIPQLGERPDIAIVACSFKADGGHGSRFRSRYGSRCRRRFAGDAHQAGDDGIEFGAELIQTPQGEKGALLGTPRRIAIGLYELDVLTGTGASDLDEHATTINLNIKNVNKEIYRKNVPLQEFLEKRL